MAKHVKSYVVSGKVGVHGVSLGGSIASHIASKVAVDFLCVDRSFANLQTVVYWLGGRYLVWAFKLFTLGGWPDHILDNFRKANTEHKVFTADPYDTIIPETTSIKTNLALTLVQDRLGPS